MKIYHLRLSLWPKNIIMEKKTAQCFAHWCAYCLCSTTWIFIWYWLVCNVRLIGLYSNVCSSNIAIKSWSGNSILNARIQKKTPLTLTNIGIAYTNYYLFKIHNERNIDAHKKNERNIFTISIFYCWLIFDLIWHFVFQISIFWIRHWLMYSFFSVIHRLVRQLIIKAIINKGLNYIDQTARATLKLHARNVDYTSVKIMHTYIPQKDTECRMDGNNFIIPCQTKVLRFVFIHPDFITLFPCSDCML